MVYAQLPIKKTSEKLAQPNSKQGEKKRKQIFIYLIFALFSALKSTINVVLDFDAEIKEQSTKSCTSEQLQQLR